MESDETAAPAQAPAPAETAPAEPAPDPAAEPEPVSEPEASDADIPHFSLDDILAEFGDL